MQGQRRWNVVAVVGLSSWMMLRVLVGSDPLAPILAKMFQPLDSFFAKASINYSPAEVDPEVIPKQDQSSREGSVANILRKDIAGFRRLMRIDLGKSDGVRINDAVVVGQDILVGRVASLRDDSAEVMLLGDPELRVTARALDDGSHGVVKVEKGSLIFDLVPGADLEGQVIKTDGIDGKTQSGLVVGALNKDIKTTESIFGKYTVILGVNIAEVDQVKVLRSK